MQIVKVSAESDYEVVIGCDWRVEFAKAVEGYTRVAVVVSTAMKERIEKITVAGSEIHLFEVPDGEAGKNSKTLESLWNSLGEQSFTRSDLIISIGGGATSDIAGFAAATWLRGIDWVAIPTTLAGMVDAAIGGKTGMNSAFGKNLIGAFHSPQKVIVDLEWLKTLADRDFSAGLAEVIKCGFIADTKILDIIESNSLPQIRASKSTTEELIYRSIAIKARVVGEDFRDSYAREVLNYGHTLGHAIELHSKFSLRHGEAVSIGMVFAAELARSKGVLANEIVERHRHVLASMHLPTTYPVSALPDLMPLLVLDKKSRGRVRRFVAISDLGTPIRLEGVSDEEIARTYERVAS
jgi:3-dehydroquinate synthase